MRKEYVKPMMESEEFVSNEYVAACWRVTCDTLTGHDHCNGSSTIITDEDKNNNIREFEIFDRFPDGNVAIQIGNWYNGEIAGKGTWHHVSIEEATGEHANAS